jgi:predicted Zn-ribbon and HTH transcriptional regulator
MKQTAVEWLIDQLFELRNPTLNQIEIMKQAKEMEKKQIIDSISNANKSNNRNVSLNPEQYYNETFKNK